MIYNKYPLLGVLCLINFVIWTSVYGFEDPLSGPFSFTHREAGHNKITRDALAKLILEENLSKYTSCLSTKWKAGNKLVDGNLTRDQMPMAANILGTVFTPLIYARNHLGSHEQHFISPKSDLRSRREAKRSSFNWLDEQDLQFFEAINNDECENAIFILGKMTHLWQDMWPHSIALDSTGRPMLDQFPGPVDGLPRTFPSDEHPLFKYWADNTLNPDPRVVELVNNATEYTINELRVRLTVWAQSCCYRKPIIAERPKRQEDDRRVDENIIRERQIERLTKKINQAKEINLQIINQRIALATSGIFTNNKMTKNLEEELSEKLDDVGKISITAHARKMLVESWEATRFPE
ncbi:MAG: hypothetical protein HY072_02120, partial [Deltaproteobacteria bacterium]|nr:hypothetical protein [Deltaproteobacteria bacterium]